MADKGFAGTEFEQFMATLGAHFLRPDRRDERHRHGTLGPVRQSIESVFWTCKGQLTLKARGGCTLPGVCTRVALRLLAPGRRPAPQHDMMSQAGTSPPTATDWESTI